MAALIKIFGSTVQASETVSGAIADTTQKKATYALEVDWDNDGYFTQEGDDITDDCWTISCWRGRNYDSQLSSKSSAGTLQAVLNNNDGKYSSFNVLSPLYGKILPNLPVRFRVTSPSNAVLWTGYLEEIEPIAQKGPFVSAVLKAKGVMGQLKTRYISPPAQVSVSTGSVINGILDDMDWPEDKRQIDDGEVTIGRWFIQDKSSLEAIYEMEEAEFGFIYEGLNFDIVFESRYRRLTADRSTATNGIFSDDPASGLPYNAVEQRDPIADIFNRITATVQPYTVQALGDVWTMIDVPFDLGPGESLTYIAVGGENVAYVEEWTTPVVGTDVTQTGVSDSDIGIVAYKTATKMFITVENNHPSQTATITLLKARGTAVTRDDPYQLQSENADSISKYGIRTYPLPSPWYGDPVSAQASIDFLISKQSVVRPIVKIQLPANASAAMLRQCLERNISDMITVEADNGSQLGLISNFYIEAITHSVSRGGLHNTIFELSPAGQPGGEFWVLGTSTLDSGTVLAYA